MWTKEELTQYVKDAYERLYDLVYLRNHPLTDVLVPDPAMPRKKKAWQLHQMLLDVIEELNPGPQARTSSKEWRRHRLMVLRYEQGLDPQEVADQITTSRRNYYRMHNAGIEAIANILWDRWVIRPGSTAAPANQSQPPADDTDLLRLEVARLAQTSRNARLEQVLQGIQTLLQAKLAQRNITIKNALPHTTPNIAIEQNLLRQILLGMIGYLVERVEQATLRLTAVVEDTQVRLSIRVEPPEAVQPAPEDDVAAHLTAFDEMIHSSQAHILTLRAGQAVVGFDVQLPTTEQTVLVVDDNEDVLKLVQRFLTPHHYRVLTAQTAQQAITIARQTQPYAITLDLMMPDQDGWDLLQTLLNQPETQHIPIIICSVLKQQKDLALSLGATAFLKKPITEEALLAVLESLEDH